MFPCLAKFLEHSTQNSVQSTIQHMFFMVLNTLARNQLLNWALSGNKVLHVSKNYICQLDICCKNLSNMVQVNFPVWGTKKSCNSLESKTPSLRRQMKSFSLDEKSAFRPVGPVGPVLAFSIAGQSLLFQ